jgi:hypothetical protein
MCQYLQNAEHSSHAKDPTLSTKEPTFKKKKNWTSNKSLINTEVYTTHSQEAIIRNSKRDTKQLMAK